MDKISLLLTRHGETLENQRHILQGQLPGTLSPLGKEQAKQLAEKLRGEHLDAIVCSDLARSYDTACTIACEHGLEPLPTPLLREMDWGIYTGRSLEEVNWTQLPQGVESLEELYARAVRFVEFLKDRFCRQRVVAVGHGAFNRAIITCLRGGNPSDMTDLPIMKNAAITELTIS